ncbi:MAG: hypothetical protein OM95_16730 [Bdellovibrio sp. ArHS]|uniref:hypothetical protein n=1 Tax=Bdellovibrio sp. ArHS TaxID=1569284 RepID=UPI000582FC5F|nr:hypothetical protein [Bdellovibrio sp. ArHS]KHD87025.1 MAG: hypothetical protein OM95_16730 [Bdellovibrio sp. ArHS]
MYSVTTYMTQQAKIQKVLNSKEKASVELSTLVARGKAVLRETGSDGSQGICEFISPRSRTGGVGDIEFVIHEDSANLLDEEWTRAFQKSGWMVAPEKCPANLYQRCFVLDEADATSLSEELRRSQPILKVALIPVELRTMGGKTFIPIKRTRGRVSNARDTGVVISVAIDMKDGKGSNVEHVSDYDLLWAGEISCNKKVEGGNTLLVSASGMGSGLSNNLFLASSKTLPNPGDKFMEIAYRHETRASTEIKDGLIQADRSYDKSFALQCSERSFRCAKDAHQGRFWTDAMVGRMWATYLPRNKRIEASSVHTLNQLCFGKSDKDLNCPSAYRVESSSGFSTNFTQPLVFTENRAAVTVTMPTVGQSLCSSICTPGTDVNYNRLSQNPKDYASNKLVRAYFRSIYQQDTQIEQYDSDPKPVGCACCYKKQCQAYGLNASGGCEESPIEPLDARVPECQTQVEVEPVSSIVARESNADKCIYASADNSGKLVLSTDLCSQSLPAACFFQGKMVVSKNMNREAKSVSFIGASEACYDMGQISVDAKSFREYLRQQVGGENITTASLPPEVGGKYDYIDNAYVGSFVLPYTADMTQQLLNDMKAAGVARVWVPMRTDSAGKSYYQPFLSFAQKSPYINFNYMGNQSFEKDGNHPFRSGNSALIFANHRRWLGALEVDGNQVLNGIAPVCRSRNGTVFKSRLQAKNLEEADLACKNDGGIFLPLKNSAEIAQIMPWIAENDTRLPWPVTTDVRGVWLAYTRSATNTWEPWSKVDTATGLINVHGKSQPFDANKVTHFICRRDGTFTIQKKDQKCDSYAGLKLSAVEKAEVAELIFREDGWISESLYSLIELPEEAKPSSEAGKGSN